MEWSVLEEHDVKVCVRCVALHTAEGFVQRECESSQNRLKNHGLGRWSDEIDFSWSYKGQIFFNFFLSGLT